MTIVYPNSWTRPQTGPLALTNGGKPEDRSPTSCLIINETFLVLGVTAGFILSFVKFGWNEGPTSVYLAATILELFISILLGTLAIIRWRQFNFLLMVCYALLTIARILVLLILGCTVFSWYYAIVFTPLCFLPSSCFVARLQLQMQMSRRRHQQRGSPAYKRHHDHPFDVKNSDSVSVSNESSLQQNSSCTVNIANIAQAIRSSDPSTTSDPSASSVSSCQNNPPVKPTVTTTTNCDHLTASQ